MAQRKHARSISLQSTQGEQAGHHKRPGQASHRRYQQQRGNQSGQNVFMQFELEQQQSFVTKHARNGQAIDRRRPSDALKPVLLSPQISKSPLTAATTAAPGLLLGNCSPSFENPTLLLVTPRPSVWYGTAVQLHDLAGTCLTLLSFTTTAVCIHCPRCRYRPVIACCSRHDQRRQHQRQQHERFLLSATMASGYASTQWPAVP